MFVIVSSKEIGFLLMNAKFNNEYRLLNMYNKISNSKCRSAHIFCSTSCNKFVLSNGFPFCDQFLNSYYVYALLYIDPVEEKIGFYHMKCFA